MTERTTDERSGRTGVAALTESSDMDLLQQFADGDESAYELLWRRHEAAARRLAGQLTRPSNVDDLVSEAFLRVLRALKAGGGPTSAFRPYLFNTIRRLSIDTSRAYHQRIVLTGDEADLDVGLEDSADDVYDANADQCAAWRAWQSLPDDSRTLLWHLIVEEETPAKIAPLLGVSPNGVSSRAVRARERLRQAFLTQHVSLAGSNECRTTRRRLAGYLRNAVSQRQRAAVEAHLRECGPCTDALAELRDVNATLRHVVAPLVLGGTGVAAGYLVSAKSTAMHLAAAWTPLCARAAARAGRFVSNAKYALGGVAAAALLAASGHASGPAARPETPVALPQVHEHDFRAAPSGVTTTAPAPRHDHALEDKQSSPAPQQEQQRPQGVSGTHPPASGSAPRHSHPRRDSRSAHRTITITIRLPHGQSDGLVHLYVPNGWEVRGWSASPATKRIGVGASGRGYTWRVSGPRLSVRLRGRAAGHATARALTITSGRLRWTTYRLS